jgi:hypothetical protein
VLAEMVSNLEPNQVILEEKKLLHFGWKSRRSGFRFVWNYWVQRGLFNRDEYLGYFSKNDAAIREDFDFWRQTENPNQFEKCQCARTKIYLSKKELS